jgi:D-serine deaminase-like pyridoxal phosphate-dependent protein
LNYIRKGMGKIQNKNSLWYTVSNLEEINSPSLLVFPDRIESNIKMMISITGNVDQLRPHVKTHKMADLIRLQMKHGIYKFKTATISETEMVAECGAKDILLAVQPVGPNIRRFFELKQRYKGAKISCIAESGDIIMKLSEMAVQTGLDTQVWIDINNGMNRSGMAPDDEAVKLFGIINKLPMLKAEGIHVYDGHIRERDLSERKRITDESYAPVSDIIEKIRQSGTESVKVVAGGSPTFPVHAKRAGVESSPGTLLLWDWGYSSSFPDMDFLHAAVIIMRVISKPADELMCLDLGHKAIASEMPQPRVKILGLNNYTITNHSEEHMVIRTSEAFKYKAGDALYGIPWHICPTVDRHDFVTVVNNHRAEGQWNVEARKRKISI